MTKFCHSGEGRFAKRPKVVSLCPREFFLPGHLAFSLLVFRVADAKAGLFAEVPAEC